MYFFSNNLQRKNTLKMTKYYYFSLLLSDYCNIVITSINLLLLSMVSIHLWFRYISRKMFDILTSFLLFFNISQFKM